MVRVRTALSLFAPLASFVAACPAIAGKCAPPSEGARGLSHRPIAPDDLVRLRDIGMFDSSLTSLPSPLAISPDSQRVAFLLTQGDPDTNGYCRLMMVADIKANTAPRVVDTGGEFMTLEYDVRGLLVSVGFPDTVTPAWSPDGRWLAYLRRDKGITQLWRVSAEGGDAAPVTHSQVDIEAWAWTSNDRAVVASRPGQLAEETRIEAEGKSGWHYDARFSPQYGARPQMRGDLPRQFDTIELTTGTIRPANIAEIALLDPEPVSGVPVARTIVNQRGARTWLKTDDAAPLSPERVQFADAQGREIACTAEQCATGIVKIYWSHDERSIVYLRREGWAKSQMAFYRWDPARGNPKRLSVTNDVLLGCLPRGQRFLCLREASALPRQIAEINPETGAATTIYDPNPELASLQLGSVERLTWRNNLGLPAWGDLVLPPGYRSGEKLPMIIVQYHSDGFLRGGTGNEYPIFPLAARGFAVLSVEHPPTVAYALPKLKSRDEVNFAGIKDWADRRSELSSTLTGVALVVARGIADPRRIGITGLSDGASAARFALINSRIFSAAAISSSSLELKTTMIYGGMAWASENRKMGYPPSTRDDPDFWKPFSMVLNAQDMNVPMLIQASDDEYLLSLETFTALQENDQPVDMYIYPNEHHIKWQPEHRLAVYNRAIDWFAFWFQDKVDPDPSKATQYDRWKAMRTKRAASLSTGAATAPKP